MNTSQITLYLDVADDLSAALLETVPSKELIEKWLVATLTQIQFTKAIELTIRAVSKAESNQLNLTYRNNDKPTNVLSFPAEIPEFVKSDHIGDIAVCAEVLQEEAQAQAKTIEAHWAHLCVHGLLHLLGYDHITDKDASEMEALETVILSTLSIDDPYQVR